jgi:hypothetical protein
MKTFYQDDFLQYSGNGYNLSSITLSTPTALTANYYDNIVFLGLFNPKNTMSMMIWEG